MAGNTDLQLRPQVIYSIFVRGHTREGTFHALEGDLDRLRALGADILWLMPIHPIGEEGRKGTMGSPYAIRDYRAVMGPTSSMAVSSSSDAADSASKLPKWAASTLAALSPT